MKILSNDELNNLQLLTRKENIQKAWQMGKNKAAEWYEGVCSICGCNFTKRANQVKHNRKMGKIGPFCSRQCAGVYGKNVQMNKSA